MNKVKFLIGIFVATTALTACTVEDNPVPEEPTIVNVDDPQEQVTDQPANARQN